MRITCPNCAASYDVPEAKLVGRKAVRCSRCGKDWTPVVAAPVQEEEPPVRVDMTRIVESEAFSVPPVLAEPEPEPETEPLLEAEPAVAHPQARVEHPSGKFTAMERLSRAAEPPAPSLWVRIAWAVTAVLIVLMLWSAFSWRADIMRIWPPSTRAYAALGLTEAAK